MHMNSVRTDVRNVFAWPDSPCHLRWETNGKSCLLRQFIVLNKPLSPPVQPKWIWLLRQRSTFMELSIKISSIPLRQIRTDPDLAGSLQSGGHFFCKWQPHICSRAEIKVATKCFRVTSTSHDHWSGRERKSLLTLQVGHRSIKRVSCSFLWKILPQQE